MKIAFGVGKLGRMWCTV